MCNMENNLLTCSTSHGFFSKGEEGILAPLGVSINGELAHIILLYFRKCFFPGLIHFLEILVTKLQSIENV